MGVGNVAVPVWRARGGPVVRAAVSVAGVGAAVVRGVWRFLVVVVEFVAVTVISAFVGVVVVVAGQVFYDWVCQRLGW